MIARRPLCGFAVAAALACIVAQGCAPGLAPRPASPGAPKARPKPGYERRVDDLRAVDPVVFAGHRIAIDPGHGGRFPGSIGINGLTEAEVNLGVAHHLRGLLEGAGATVFMTRTDDRDFIAPADSSLRADLAERTRLANAAAADLFVSIHHNADAGGAHDVNETQTYYKLGDEGPSLDAAQRIHRYLVRNLGIERHRILPGNYFVLRNSVAPALLTESSYLTNPDVEAKLALGAKQRLEAEALYLGIADFFARRAPRVAAFAAYPPFAGPSDTVFSGVAAPILRARIAGPFDDYALAIDGSPVAGVRHGDEIEWRPGPLEGGRHEAVLSARLSGQGSAPAARIAFTLTREGAELAPTRFARVGREGGIAVVRIDVRDETGAAFRDSVPVRVRATLRGISPADTLLIARDGAAWGYFRVAPRTWPAAVQAWIGDRPWGDGVEADAVTWTLADRGPRADSTRWSGFVRLMPDDVPLRDAPALSGPGSAHEWLNRDGYAVLERVPGGAPRMPALAGYRAWGSDTAGPPRLVAIAGGALHGRRIVVDPEGGGDQAGGMGPSGTRGAHVNLEVARVLAGFLAAAGAEVRLTRSGDFAISEVERVEISEAFRAERFLRIGHRAQPPRLGFYFSSAPGRRWAERTGEAFARLGLDAPPLAEDAQYPLQQTSCPALYAAPARVDDPTHETRLTGPGTLRAEAYALFLAIAREWSEADWPMDSVQVQGVDGRPLAGALVTLGGALVLETDAAGWVRFARTEPGPIEVRADHVRGSARGLLLDFDRGVRVTIPNAP